MKKSRIFFIAICSLVIFSLTGCISTKNVKMLEQVEMGMSKEQARLLFGEPESIKGISKGTDGKITEILVYSFKKPGPHQNRLYWFYFTDGKLVKWEQVGKIQGDLSLGK